MPGGDTVPALAALATKDHARANGPEKLSVRTHAALGFRYSTSLLAISANRLARRPPAKTTDGRREAAPSCFVDEGGVLLSDLR